MDLKKIQNIIARLDAIENILRGFDKMANIVKDGGGMGRIEVDIIMRVKADPHEAEKPKALRPFIDGDLDTMVQEERPKAFFVYPHEAEKPKQQMYVSKMEVRPNDVETLRVLAVLVERVLKEKAQLQEELKALGVQITT